jgi:hypothetical protein
MGHNGGDIYILHRPGTCSDASQEDTKIPVSERYERRTLDCDLADSPACHRSLAAVPIIALSTQAVIWPTTT